MPDGSVRGTFDLNVRPAERALARLRRSGEGADAVMKGLGESLDNVGSTRQREQLRKYRTEVGRLGTSTRMSLGQANRAWRQNTSLIAREVRKQNRTLEGLEGRLRVLGETTARPHVEVTGLPEALADVALLKRELRSVGRSRATATIGTRGGGAAALGPLGGVDGSAARATARNTAAARGRLRDFRIMGIGIRGIAAAAVVGLPAIRALVGATGALAGTLSGAAVGGGAVGVAGFGALATGILGTYAVAKPLATTLGEVWKQQQNVNTAIQTYGKGSTQATTATKKLHAALKLAPEGAKELVSEAGAFQRSWARATRSGQQDLIDFGRTAVRQARNAEPFLAGQANRATGATTREGARFTGFLTGNRRFRAGVGAGVGIFDQNLGSVRVAAQESLQAVGNITRASRPFFREGAEWLERWTKGWSGSTDNISRTRRTIGGFVKDFRSLSRLTGATWRLLRDILFPEGTRRAGRGIVDDLTGQLNEWDRWVKNNPEKMRQFFSDSVSSTEKMATAVGHIVKGLWDMAKALGPILDRFSNLISLLGNAGFLGSPGALAAGLGAFGALRGRGRGGGGGRGVTAIGGPGGSAMAVLPVGAPGRRGAGGRAGQRIYGQGFRYGAPESQLGPRGVRGALGRGARGAAGAVRTGAGGAARSALPVMALFALADASQAGLSAADRPAAALSDLTFGLIPSPTTQGQKNQTSARRAQQLIGNVRGGASQRNAQLAYLRSLLAPGEMTQARSDRLDAMQRRSGFRFPRGFKGFEGGAEGLQQARTVVINAQRAELHQQRVVSRQRGLSAAQGFQQAFPEQMRGRGGIEGAVGRTNRNVLAKMKALGPEGRKALAASMLAWEKQVERKNPQIAGHFNDFKKRIVKTFRDLGVDIRVINGQIFDGSQRQWRQIQRALTDPMEQAEQQNHKHFTAIQRQAISALRTMGFSSHEARALVSGLERGEKGAKNEVKKGASRTHAQQSQAGKNVKATRARGGRIPDLGAGLRDHVPLGDGQTLGGAGELVVNRHSEMRDDRNKRRVWRMTGIRLPTINEQVRQEGRSHHQPPTPTNILGKGELARGGRLETTSTNAGNYGGPWGSGSGFIPVTALAKRDFSLQPTAGRTNHSTNTVSGNVSDHSWGGAVDYSNSTHPTPQMDEWVKFWGNAGLHGSANGPSPIKQMLYRTMIGGNHFNHVHTALLKEFAFNPGKMSSIINARSHGAPIGTGAGKGTGAIPQLGPLAVPGTNLQGVPGALVDRSGSLYARGLRQAVNKELLRRGGTSGAKAGTGRSRTVTASTYGGSTGSFGALTGNAWAELSDPPASHNWSALAHAFGRSREFPGGQKARVTYKGRSVVGTKKDRGAGGGGLHGHLRAIDLHTGMARNLGFAGLDDVDVEMLARGGRLGRAATAGGLRGGGSFVASSPSVFRAGESRHKERIDVTPLRRSGGMREPDRVGKVEVHLHGLDPSKPRQLDVIGHHVAKRIMEHLDTGSVPAKAAQG